MEPEHRPFIFRTVDPNFALHKLDEPLRNGQPQSGAVMAAVAFVFDLLKFAKDVVKLVFRNADTSIFDCNVNAAFVIVVAGQANHLNRHVTFVGELDRIAHEVGQDLTQPARVAKVFSWHEQVIVHCNLESFFPRGWRQKRDDVVDAAFQIEGLGLQIDLLGLDLRVVQNIVDNDQKRFTR